MKKHAGIDVQAMYPAGAPPKADNWTLDTFLKAAEACHKGGVPVRHRARRDHRQRRYRRRDLPVVRRRSWSTPRATSPSRPTRCARRSNYYKKLIAFLPPDVGGLGRRLQQQVAGLRQGRADHEPAERLGGRQARRAAGRRAVLDARLPGRTEGPLRAVPALLLGHLELLQEQGSGQEPARCICRSRRRSRRWCVASGGYDLPATRSSRR